MNYVFHNRRCTRSGNWQSNRRRTVTDRSRTTADSGKRAMIFAGMLVVVGAMSIVTAVAQTSIGIGSPAASGTGWTFADRVVRITANGDYEVTGATTANRIAVASGVTARITLNGVSIVLGAGSPLSIECADASHGADVTLVLRGDNTLRCTVGEDTQDDNDIFFAGIQVEGGSRLTIESYAGASSGESVLDDGIGSLVVQGGYAAAGIGSSFDEHNESSNGTGTIIINSGNITVTGGALAAGIGGTYGATGGNITITGGTITVTGGDSGAGIGGGRSANGGNITITGGIVTANGGHPNGGYGGGGAGIGGGQGAGSGNINIAGGLITANGGENTGAGIGSGERGGADGNINISGGVVYAYGTESGAGIGGGIESSAGNINISGGAVYAYTEVAATIGAGRISNSDSEGNITITGGTIIAAKIGISMDADWHDMLTPLRITGANTVVIASAVNGYSANNNSPTILTGHTFDKTLIQAFAKGETNRIDQSVFVNYDTTTVTRHDTIIRHDTIKVHDTIHVDTLYIYTDTAYKDTNYLTYDSVSIVYRDSLIYDSIVYRYDTQDMKVTDTLHVNFYVYDTVATDVYDTTHVNVYVYDTTLVPETIVIHTTDTIVRTVETKIYIIIDPNTGATTAVTTDARLSLAPDGSTILEGLTPGAAIAVYNLSGTLVFRSTAPDSGTCALPILTPGVYILYHATRYSKFVQQ